MIECICIDDSGRPPVVPPHKWLEKDKTYHIVFARMVLPQRTLGVELAEIVLDESCAPYEYFLGKRFVIKASDMDALIELIKETSGVQTSIQEIQKQTGHVVGTRS